MVPMLATWNKLEHAITNVQRAELGLDPRPVNVEIICRYLFEIKKLISRLCTRTSLLKRLP